MENITGQSCPINQKSVDEKVVQLIAIQVFALSVLTLIIPQIWIPLFLLTDFGLRAFADGRGSLLRWNALEVKKLLRLESSGTNAAPKQFAAKIGAIFSVLIFSFLLSDLTFLAAALGGILSACAALEGFFNYCVGCTFYQLLQRFSVIRF